MTEEKIKDIYKKTLQEIIDEYCLLFNPECCYYYGVIRQEDADKMWNEYNIETEYPEAIITEPIIPLEILLDDEKPIIKQDKIKIIMDNLGITKKQK